VARLDDRVADADRTSAISHGDQGRVDGPVLDANAKERSMVAVTDTVKDSGQGMTLKQMGRHRFLLLLAQYRKLRDGGLQTPEEQHAFVLVSVQLHAAKGLVPKRWWPLVNK
jgi:hypothetical protein